MRYIFYTMAVLLLLIGGTVTVFSLWDARDKYDVETVELAIPRFERVELSFAHRHEWGRGLPYAAGAIIDVDNDGVEELFLGGGVRQSDGLFRFEEGEFVNIIDQAGIVKQGDVMTLGATVVDVDDNGWDDLIVSRESGIWLYFNRQGRFEMERLDIAIPDDGAPLAVSVADINNDGFFDFFLPIVGRRGPVAWLTGDFDGPGVRPRLYLNRGDHTFTESAETLGIVNIGEAVQAGFEDLDNDGREDLTVLHSDGTLSTWENLGNLLFESKSHFHTSREGLYSALGFGDYDEDGRVDLFLGNRGSTHPQPVARYYMKRKRTPQKKWVLMNNVGQFTFREDAVRARLADYQLSRGSLFTDLNNDGRTDLVVCQNHPYWPPFLLEWFRLPGKIFLQTEDGRFAPVGVQAGVENKAFGVAPLRADFNEDGRPDLVFVNFNGPAGVFLSKADEEEQNGYINVDLPGAARSLGAVVEVRMLSGKVRRQGYPAGRVLCSDSSHALHFGLGEEKAVNVLVTYGNGDQDQTSGVLRNTTVTFE